MQKPYLFTVHICNFLDDTSKAVLIMSENSTITKEQAERVLNLNLDENFVRDIYKPNFYFDTWSEEGFDDMAETFNKISNLINL